MLSREDALRLVVLRGELMAEADDVGSMLALVGATAEDAEAVAAAAGVTVANDNAPGQVVLSGPRDALARAEEAARERGRRALPLDVAGAFHSPSMEPAVAPFRAALDATELHEGAFTVFSCASTKPFEDVRAELAGRADAPRPLARDRARPARGRRAPLRRGRPRQGARPPGQAHPARLPRRDSG